MQPVLSYLVPSYNHAQYLPALLESIKCDIAELNLRAEVVIIDDGSADDSPSIIQNWAFSNQHLCKISYHLQKNSGLTKVLNRLVSLAEGQYIRFGSSDDLIVPGSTQFLYDQFQSRPKLLCALGDAQVIDEAGMLVHPSSIRYHKGKHKRLNNPKKLVKELVQHWCLAGPSHVIKKTHYETMRYDEKSRIDDYDLFLSLLSNPDAVLYFDKIVCAYRIHATNTCKTKNTKNRIANIVHFLEIINRHIDKGILKPYLLPMKYKTKAKIHFLQGQYLSCCTNMCLSLLYRLKI